MSIEKGIMVIQITVGFGALSMGLYLGGMKELWWLAIIGVLCYCFGMILPFALTGKGIKR